MNCAAIVRVLTKPIASMLLLGCAAVLAVTPPQKTPPANPYQVERSWPPYFLEHQKLFTEKAGTYKAGKYPVWTIHVPGGWIGNSTVIEGYDGLIVYDTSVNIEAGAFIAEEIRKISAKPIKAIFYSHRHTDHYNGTSALVTPEQVADGSVKIYAWDNFEEEVVNEFGAILPRQIWAFFTTGQIFCRQRRSIPTAVAPPRYWAARRGISPLRIPSVKILSWS